MELAAKLDCIEANHNFITVIFLLFSGLHRGKLYVWGIKEHHLSYTKMSFVFVCFYSSAVSPKEDPEASVHDVAFQLKSLFSY